MADPLTKLKPKRNTTVRKTSEDKAAEEAIALLDGGPSGGRGSGYVKISISTDSN